MVHIIGHKGACGYATENTLESFSMAIQAGCSRAELDVRLTADNRVVVIHDDTVDRTTNGTGLVKSFTLENLKKLRCENNQSIPTLQEVIDFCADKIDLQIELKESGTPLPVHQIITENKINNRVVISSFYSDLLLEIRSLNDTVKTLLLLSEQPDNLWETAIKLRLFAIGPKADKVTETMINDAHAQELAVYAYYTNTPELGEKLLNMGVDELGTDYPRLFTHRHF